MVDDKWMVGRRDDGWCTIGCMLDGWCNLGFIGDGRWIAACMYG